MEADIHACSILGNLILPFSFHCPQHFCVSNLARRAILKFASKGLEVDTVQRQINRPNYTLPPPPLEPGTKGSGRSLDLRILDLWCHSTTPEACRLTTVTASRCSAHWLQQTDFCYRVSTFIRSQYDQLYSFLRRWEVRWLQRLLLSMILY